MRVHVLSSWGNATKCKACRSFFAFRNEFNKFNNTRAQMLDSMYHMALKIL